MELLEQLEHFSLYSHFSLLCKHLRLRYVFHDVFHNERACSTRSQNSPPSGTSASESGSYFRTPNDSRYAHGIVTPR